MVVKFRNTLFDLKIIKSKSFDIPIISIGNITVGGTGKTPSTEYIVRTLQNDYKIAVLSRGYKRKTKGFVLANSNSSVDEIGDESYQIKQKFPNITVAVAEKRIVGIKELQKLEQKFDLIILDDAFQHRKVTPGFSILIIDHSQPFFNDHFLPYGRKRDSINEIYRANLILVTKAPKDIKPIEMRIVATDLNLKAYQTLYFSSIKYGDLKSVYNLTSTTLNIESLKENNYSIILLTGIGNYKPILNYCKNISEEVIHIKFADHYNYSIKDIRVISDKFKSLKNKNKIILTTEKDAVKIKNISIEDTELKSNFYYCPIEIEILNNEKDIFKNDLIKFLKTDIAQYRFLTSKKQY